MSLFSRFSKSRKKSKVIEELTQKLKLFSAFARHMNNGKLPQRMKESDYVLGYHWRMAGILIDLHYREGLTHEDVGDIFLWTLSEVLEVEKDAVGKRLMPLLEEPNTEFTEGTDDADKAFEDIASGNDEAFVEFNIKTRRLR
jgi:hypothetical protein